jgi:hypothetical protein
MGEGVTDIIAEVRNSWSLRLYFIQQSLFDWKSQHHWFWAFSIFIQPFFLSFYRLDISFYHWDLLFLYLNQTSFDATDLWHICSYISICIHFCEDSTINLILPFYSHLRIDQAHWSFCGVPLTNIFLLYTF